MSEQRYDLKLADGRTASWVGKTPEDAARRYVDCVRPGSPIVATRPARDEGVHVLGRGRIIG